MSDTIEVSPHAKHTEPEYSIPRCGSCKYWTGPRMAKSDKEVGECHRFPAQVGGLVPQQTVSGIQPAAMTVFPTLRAEQWCGEHVSSLH